MSETVQKKVTTPQILVVEDDAEMRDLLKEELSDEGYRVIEAEDGEDAASKLRSEVFDVIITDIRMPRVGGIELLTSVTKAYPRTPVIVITAFGSPEILDNACEKGAFDYIGKPFKLQDLKNAVRKALQWEGER